MALASPSAEANKRRVPDQQQIRKHQRDLHYKGGSERYGDVTQWDGIVRDSILGRNWFLPADLHFSYFAFQGNK